MRILHVIQRFWPARGGAEQHLLYLSEHAVAQGHEVTVATTDALDFEYFWSPERRRVMVARESYHGLLVRRFPVRHLPGSPLSYHAVRRLLWLLSRAGTPVALLHRLARLTPHVPEMRSWLADHAPEYDVIAAMTITFEPLVEAALRAARRAGRPFVLYPLTHLGAGPMPGQDALSRFYTMRHQLDLARRSDAIIAQTPTEADFLKAHGAGGRIEVVGPGITPEVLAGGDGSRFRAAHGITGPMVLALGSMSEDKGTTHVVEAVHRLWQSGQALSLVLAGAVLDPFRAFLDRLPPDTRQRIHLLGPIDEAEKRDALAAATLLAMPSRTDSFGIVYLEAWCYGKAVIAARTWGVMDLIDDGVDGLLVPFGAPEDLATALARLLAEPARAAAMGDRGREKALHHTWARKGAQVEAVYRALVEAT